MATCKNCGRRLSKDANFCPKCGFPTNVEIQDYNDEMTRLEMEQPQDENDYEMSETEVGLSEKIITRTLFVILMAFIIFLRISCKESKSKNNDPQKQKTEQVEKKSEQKVPKELTAKEREVANNATEVGRAVGMALGGSELSNMIDAAEDMGHEDDLDNLYEKQAGDAYNKDYGVPSNSEEKRLKQIYVEYYLKAMEAAMEAMN